MYFRNVVFPASPVKPLTPISNLFLVPDFSHAMRETHQQLHLVLIIQQDS